MTNPYLWVPLLTWLIAQVLKFALRAINGDIRFNLLFSSGGMPSAHAATVTAMAVTALLVAGINSPIFGLAGVFAAIVIYDSFGVRRSSGEQAIALNELAAKLNGSTNVREVNGHTPLEVLMGVAVGVLSAGLMNSGRLGWLITWKTAQPSRPEMLGYAIFAGLLVVSGLVLLIVRRQQKSDVLKKMYFAIIRAAFILGVTGLLIVAAEYENAQILHWRAWFYLVPLGAILWGILIYRQNRDVDLLLHEESERSRKAKWLPAKRKRRRK